MAHQQRYPKMVFDKNLPKDTLIFGSKHLDEIRPQKGAIWCKGLVTWTQLAAVDHQSKNTSRNYATTLKGENEEELCYKVAFPKHKNWIPKP